MGGDERRGTGEAASVSNHVRERHRILRNQLNGESLAPEGDGRRAGGWKGLKKEAKGWGQRADCSVKWMKRGKTKIPTKDGTCSNQGISLGIHARIHVSLPARSFLSPSVPFSLLPFSFISSLAISSRSFFALFLFFHQDSTPKL